MQYIVIKEIFDDFDGKGIMSKKMKKGEKRENNKEKKFNFYQKKTTKIWTIFGKL